MRTAELRVGDTILVNVRADQFEARYEGPIAGWEGHFRITPLAPGRGLYSVTAAQIDKRLAGRRREAA